MRARGLSLLMAAVFAATMNAQAATPVVDSVSVGIPSGKSIVLTGSKKLVYTPRLGARVKATVTCLAVFDSNAFLSIPPLPPQGLAAKQVYGRATANNGQSYYFRLFSVSAKKGKNVQTVILQGISQTGASGACGAGIFFDEQAVGVVVYR